MTYDEKRELIAEARELVKYGSDLNTMEADRLIGELCDALATPVEPSCAICGDGLPSLLVPNAARVDPIWALRFGIPREANVCQDCYRAMRDRWHEQNPAPAVSAFTDKELSVLEWGLQSESDFGVTIHASSDTLDGVLARKSKYDTLVRRRKAGPWEVVTDDRD